MSGFVNEEKKTQRLKLKLEKKRGLKVQMDGHQSDAQNVTFDWEQQEISFLNIIKFILFRQSFIKAI